MYWIPLCLCLGRLSRTSLRSFYLFCVRINTLVRSLGTLLPFISHQFSYPINGLSLLYASCTLQRFFLLIHLYWGLPRRLLLLFHEFYRILHYSSLYIRLEPISITYLALKPLQMRNAKEELQVGNNHYLNDFKDLVLCHAPQ